MEKLNIKQRETVMHILHCVKTNIGPFYIFLSGSAGVGKSTVINAIYQTVSYYLSNMPGEKKDVMHVLLCAPSGKAAFLIGGVTLHTAFKLPISQNGRQMPDLGAKIANTIRVELFHLKILIIDEISMVGARMLSRVDTRLRQIKGINEPFGGVSVVVVGDLHQLPPVMDVPVFKSPNVAPTSALVYSVWNIFEFYELTQVMRQKNEVKLINALNNLANVGIQKEDVELIRERCVTKEKVPDEAIRLYASNSLVDLYNKNKIKSFKGEEFTSRAYDHISADISENQKDKLLMSLKCKKTSESSGLPYEVLFKVGIKYMLTNNIDVQDGLVNGACCVLKKITFKCDKISKIWIDFDFDKVGRNARNKLKDFMLKEGIEGNVTPISRQRIPLNISRILSYQVIREQFPIVAAEAITIHKSQGQTYNHVCLDLQKCQRITKSMLYVALSRTRELQGLHIIGDFEPPKEQKVKDPINIEINRLKKEKKEKLSFDNLTNNTGKKIIFLNTRSLKMHASKIVNDHWYHKGDILIFVETRLKKDDIIEIPSFKKIFRSTTYENVQLRGIIVFSKKELEVEVLKHIVHIEKDDKNSCIGQVDLICLKVQEIIIIGGYKSPKVNYKSFIEIFTTAINFVSKNNPLLLVIGDFNIDLNDDARSSTLKRYILQNNLSSALPEGTKTTDFNTQIDVIFTNIEHYSCGTYETYFSDHKPIFIQILGNDSSKSCKDNKFLHSFDNLNICENSKLCDIDEQLSQEFERINIVEEFINNEKNNNKFEVINIDDNDEDLSYILSIPDFELKIEEIETPGVCLTSEHINLFGDLINLQFSHYQHQNTMFLQFPHRIKEIQKEKSNLKILYSGPTESSKYIGHWICTYYDGTKINIYDSMNSGILNNQQNLFLNKLYPWKPKLKFHLVQQ